jgi:hypothetical protein
MKVFLIILAIVVALALMGWISFTATDSSATVTIDRQEIRNDTAQAARVTQDTFRQVTTAISMETDGSTETEEQESESNVRDPIVEEDAARQTTP